VPIIENAYYNYHEVDCSPIDDFRVGYWGETDKKITADTKILNHDEKGFLHNPWILSFLAGMFNQKCKGEK
jgi:hypothetical protein